MRYIRSFFLWIISVLAVVLYFVLFPSIWRTSSASAPPSAEMLFVMISAAVALSFLSSHIYLSKVGKGPHAIFVPSFTFGIIVSFSLTGYALYDKMVLLHQSVSDQWVIDYGSNFAESVVYYCSYLLLLAGIALVSFLAGSVICFITGTVLSFRNRTPDFSKAGRHPEKYWSMHPKTIQMHVSDSTCITQIHALADITSDIADMQLGDIDIVLTIGNVHHHPEIVFSASFSMDMKPYLLPGPEFSWRTTDDSRVLEYRHPVTDFPEWNFQEIIPEYDDLFIRRLRYYAGLDDAYPPHTVDLPGEKAVIAYIQVYHVRKDGKR